MRKMSLEKRSLIRRAAALAACLLLAGCQKELPAPAPSPVPAPPPGLSRQEPPAPAPTPSPTPSPPRGPSDYRPQVPDARPRLGAEQDNSAEAVGWLYIPGTAVDEPVYQTLDNTYYLFHDGQGRRRQSGCLFVDYECTLGDGRGESFSQNTIIYGHNLGNPVGVADDPEAERFAQLLKFTDATFANAHPYLYFTTPAGLQTYEIFAVSYTDAQTEPSYILASYKTGEFLQLLELMRARSLYDYPVPVGAQDKLLTLSCCTHKYGTEAENPYQRFVIMARLLPAGWPCYEQAGISPNRELEEPDFSIYSTRLTPEQRLASLNWFSLTREQKLRDIDFILNTLRENYPYFAALRRNGRDLEAMFQALREEAAATASDAEYFELLSVRLSQLPGVEMENNPWTFPDTAAEYARLAAQGGGTLEKALAALYGEARVQQSYRALGGPYSRMLSYRSAYFTAQEAQGDPGARHRYPGDTRPDPAADLPAAGEGGEPLDVVANDNVTTVFAGERVAYARVQTLDTLRSAKDGPFLQDFFRRARDCANVILDLCGSGGEDTDYFAALLAPPLLSAPRRAAYIEAMPGGTLNRRFAGTAGGAWKPLEDLGTLPLLPEADRAGLALARRRQIVLAPAAQPNPPQGKIWLLVDGEGGWAAQNAAWLCKETGLATLVGTAPRSAGVGSEPFGFALPASGWVVRYSGIYEMTPAGACAREDVGAAIPDFAPAPGETPLQACLRLIDGQTP